MLKILAGLSGLLVGVSPVFAATLFDDFSIDPIISGGAATGLPPDSPATRVDPNTTTSTFAGVGSVQIGSSICTGTMVSPTVVLTAAHCLGSSSSNPVAASSVTFHLNASGDDSSVIGASAVVLNPSFSGFNSPNLDNDLALVTLSTPVPMGTPIYSLYGAPIAQGRRCAYICRLWCKWFG